MGERASGSPAWPAELAGRRGTARPRSCHIESVPSTGVFHLGGAFGLATAGIAWYVSFAIALNKTFGRNLLPLGSFWGAAR